MDPSWTLIVYHVSQGGVAVPRNLIHYNVSKHIEVRYQFIQECITQRNLDLEKISMANNVTDAMNISLPQTISGHCGSTWAWSHGRSHNISISLLVLNPFRSSTTFICNQLVYTPITGEYRIWSNGRIHTYTPRWAIFVI